jgi:DNA-binding NarL/FixJ family response regulator
MNEFSGTAPTAAPNVSVWLVDDDDRFRALVAELLSRRDGIQCARQFASPDALLSALASKPGPDVILLDVQMGDQNGLDAVRPIKSLARSTRVLMYTTCHDQQWRERALRDGASDYLLKTDPVEKVVARIRSPADDAAPNNYPRRRSKRSAEKLAQPPAANPLVDESAHALRRSLKMLRSLWN